MRLSYKEQLNHPKWQRRRLERLEAAGWKCQECAAEDQQLHVHHERYVAGLLAWQYDDALLSVLCHKCHAAHHQKEHALAPLIFKGTSRLEARAAWLEGHGGPADRAELEMARAKLKLQVVDAELVALFEAGAPSDEAKDRSRELMTARKLLKSVLHQGAGA